MNSGRRSVPSITVFAVLVAAIGYCSASGGQTPDPPDSLDALSLQEAVARALAANPGLKAAQFDVTVEQARRDYAALPTPLQIETQVENFAGSGVASSFGGAEVTLQLGKVIELGGKQRLRTELGEARVSLAELDRDIARLNVAAEVARRFVDVVIHQERVTLAREAIALIVQTNDIVRRRVEVGRTSDAQRMTTEITLAQARLGAERIQSELEAARVRLSTLWAQETPDFSSVAAELYRLPPTASFDDLRRGLENNPELGRFLDAAQIQEAQRRLAESGARPNLLAAAGVRHLGQVDDFGLVFSLSMPIGSATRAGPGVAEAQARVDQSPMNAEQRRLELSATLFGFFQQLSNARSEYMVLSGELLPQAEEAARLYQQGFELGSQTLLELSQAQNQLVALRVDQLAAASTFHRTLIEIDYLLGGTGPSGVSQ